MTNQNRGREFKPREPYTHRLRKILEEYPDGSQVLREILQNSDDAKSTEQVFILDHNTYSSNKLLKPELTNYQRFDLKLDRYQGPALIAKNNTIFEERDFQSLLKLADSEKRDQFDKIGVMGVGFNSIYHITDSPSFITGDKYVILDPHEWYFPGGYEFDFGEKLVKEFPDQFAPFRISYNEPYQGTIFRYPLRNSDESDISKKIYRPDEILDMFHKFYENESINCLLFLKYIECISFYELKKGDTEPKLFYKVQLTNADKVRQKRRLIVEKVVPMMNSLNSGELNGNTQLETSYVASFCCQKGDSKETSNWLILNYLDDLLKTEEYFQKNFGKNIGEFKFIPNVGLAVPLNNLINVPGRLFCFLPLPIDMPFTVSVHGYFAVSTNRRSLWSPADKEDLADDSLARLKITWNQYLFEKVLPKAWIKFLYELQKVPDVRLKNIYEFWPIERISSNIRPFCKDLLQNVIECLSIEDRIFKGKIEEFTYSLNTSTEKVLSLDDGSYDTSSSESHWISLSDGYLDDKQLDFDLLKIIENIGFPVISVPPEIRSALKDSRHKDSLKILSPVTIRTYLKSNRTKWENDAIPKEEVLQLFEYILKDQKFDELEGFKMIPLANGNLGTITLSRDSCVYIEYIDFLSTISINWSNSIKNQLNTDKLIDRSINSMLYKSLYTFAKNGWNLNIKTLDEIEVKDLIFIIENMVKGNENRNLSTDEIRNVVEILELIVKNIKKRIGLSDGLNKLDGLLIPNTENRLVKLEEIYFNDMGDVEGALDDEDRNRHIVHRLVTRDIVETLGIRTLRESIFDNNYSEDIDWEDYEQNESLTTRIKNIVKDYKMGSLFKEFLQNADDARANHFLVIVDERKDFQCSVSEGSFKMEDWQGPAIWIYNDAEFTDDDFQYLLKLGIGGKHDDDKKIGRFGIGFNCAFHLTDLPSFVSRKYIAFLDPHARFLPPQGYPPRRLRGTRIDARRFKEKYPTQCRPYEVIFDFIKRKFPEKYGAEGCDLSKEFNGTLFRLPLRTHKLASASKISTKVIDINEILKLFAKNYDINEMLFLRNIESCSLYHILERDPEMIWQAKISNIDDCRDSRQNVTDGIDDALIYQLEIERENCRQNEKISEIWILCNGGHDVIESRLKNFSEERHLKPRGGVASLLAQSNDRSLDELRVELAPDPPELKGEIYSYLSLSIYSELGVHLNGNFSLSSARSVTQSENDFLQADCDDTKWNIYILHNVLPDLHVKLLDYIVNMHENEETNFVSYVTKNLWPTKATDLYKDYCLSVVRRLGHESHRVFWTEVNDGVSDGRFISLEEAKIFNAKKEEETAIADLLTSSEVSAVKLEEEKIKQLEEIVKSEDPPGFPYNPVSGESVCEILHCIPDIHDKVNDDQDSLFKLIKFIFKDKNSFNNLNGLPLVPLINGVGKFGETYYIIGNKDHLKLFPDSKSKFVSMKLPDEIRSIFNSDDFLAFTSIKRFDAFAVLDLLPSVIRPVSEFKWDPNGNSIPNKSWLDKIWRILSSDNGKVIQSEFNRISRFPLLPMIRSSENMLVRPDKNNPLLYMPENGHALFPLFEILSKLKVRFTDLQFPGSFVICNSINIINSLEKARSSLTMKRLFEASKLTPSEYEKFRTYIKGELETLIAYGQSQGKFMSVLKSLPIWPIHYYEDKFIDTSAGNLFDTSKIPFFSFFNVDNFYKHESDFNTLKKLGVVPMDIEKYLKDYIIPQITKKFPKPSAEYVDFLMNILSLGNEKIEQLLEQYQMIPNKTLTGLFKANTLYDSDVQLFHKIFNKDKFLPSALQDNPACLSALERMGLNRKYKVPKNEQDKHDQKDILSDALVKFLKNGSEYHDVKFIIGKIEFNANKYVLSAASESFEEEFRESGKNEIRVPDDIKPESIEILLLWLYGQSFEEAKESIIKKLTDFDEKKDYVPFLINILKVSEIYKVEKLKDTIENAIKEGQYMGVNDVCKILKYSKEYNAQKSREFYEEYVKLNKEIFNGQLEQSANDEMSKMLKPLLEG